MLRIETVGDLLPGDIGFSTLAGRVGAGVSLGQALLRDECRFTHTYIVAIADGHNRATILEAMPRGARTVQLVPGADRIGPGHAWIRLPLADAQRTAMFRWALEHVGTPYSFLDYLSLAMLHAGAPRRWVAGRVTSSGHMICSQLVDAALADAGFHLFEDGRLPQDVTPGGLFWRAGALGETVWW